MSKGRATTTGYIGTAVRWNPSSKDLSRHHRDEPSLLTIRERTYLPTSGSDLDDSSRVALLRPENKKSFPSKQDARRNVYAADSKHDPTGRKGRKSIWTIPARVPSRSRGWIRVERDRRNAINDSREIGIPVRDGTSPWLLRRYPRFSGNPNRAV